MVFIFIAYRVWAVALQPIMRRQFLDELKAHVPEPPLHKIYEAPVWSFNDVAKHVANLSQKEVLKVPPVSSPVPGFIIQTSAWISLNCMASPAVNIRANVSEAAGESYWPRQGCYPTNATLGPP